MTYLAVKNNVSIFAAKEIEKGVPTSYEVSGFFLFFLFFISIIIIKKRN